MTSGSRRVSGSVIDRLKAKVTGWPGSREALDQLRGDRVLPGVARLPLLWDAGGPCSWGPATRLVSPSRAPPGAAHAQLPRGPSWSCLLGAEQCPQVQGHLRP